MYIIWTLPYTWNKPKYVIIYTGKVTGIQNWVMRVLRSVFWAFPFRLCKSPGCSSGLFILLQLQWWIVTQILHYALLVFMTHVVYLHDVINFRMYACGTFHKRGLFLLMEELSNKACIVTQAGERANRTESIFKIFSTYSSKHVLLA